VVHVINGKVERREAPVLPGKRQRCWRWWPGAKLTSAFLDRVPGHADIHALRREYAQALYLHHAPGSYAAPATGTLPSSDYDKAAALKVSAALGHSRLDVVLRYYIR